LKEVKARLYGKDGYAVEKPVSQGIEGRYLKAKARKERKQTYDGQVTAALAKVWEIFDWPLRSKA